MKLLLYCCKRKPYLVKDGKKYIVNGTWWLEEWSLNGKIVAECDFEVEEIKSSNLGSFEKESCIDRVSMLKYLKPNLIWNKKFEGLLKIFGSLTFGYAIHIKNLHIFDKPKELSDYHISYYNKELKMQREKHIEKAPQNMCYVFDINDNYVLISIQPQWLYKILNGEKTIEVRKKVLKEML